MERTVGVDIGGSGVRAAVVDRAGEVGAIRRVALGSRSVDAVIAAVAEAVDGLDGGCFGVGVPGFVHEGVVLGSPNFPEWREVCLADRLAERLGARVHLENDANAAAWGAWVRGGRSGDWVVLTLGTGVGGGVITGGRLLRGAGGVGAEVGHLFAGGDRPCGCGGVGCLETWVGTVGLSAAAEAVGLEAREGAALVAAAQAGDRRAIVLLAEAAMALGRGMVSLVNLFNPDRVHVLGGLSEASRWLAPAEAWMRARAIPPAAARAQVSWGGRADDLAIAGAADLAGAR